MTHPRWVLNWAGDSRLVCGFLYILGTGTTKNCQDIAFCGAGPASEPETKAVSSLLDSKKESIVCFLTLRSYGQLLLVPYGYTTNKSSHHKDLVRPERWEKPRGSPASFPCFCSKDSGSSPAFVLSALPSFLSPAFCTLPDACWKGFGLNAALPTLIN